MSGSSESAPWQVVLSESEGASVCYTHQKLDCQEAVSEFLAAATRNSTVVIPGKPGRIPPESPATALVYADVSLLKAVREHQVADQVISVECGIEIAELNAMLALKGQWWPVLPPFPGATLFDVINSGAGGALEQKFGGPRELVLGGSVSLATGESIKCGGKVVKNVSGYDMTKLFIGAHGSLGLMTMAHLRLYALPESKATVCFGADDFDELMQICRRLLSSGFSFSSLELLDARAIFSEQGQKSGCLEALVQPLGMAGGRKYWLLLAAHGLPSVVDEVINACVSQAALVSTRIDNSVQDEVWAQLSAFSCLADDSRVEIACCPISQHKLLAALLQGSNPPYWQARPGRGRLSLFPCGQTTKEALIEQLRQFARGQSQSFSIAYSNQRFNYQVERLPESDAPSDQLKRRLKERFDPGGILNPFVSL